MLEDGIDGNAKQPQEAGGRARRRRGGGGEWGRRERGRTAEDGKDLQYN